METLISRILKNVPFILVGCAILIFVAQLMVGLIGVGQNGRLGIMSLEQLALTLIGTGINALYKPAVLVGIAGVVNTLERGAIASKSDISGEEK